MMEMEKCIQLQKLRKCLYRFPIAATTDARRAYEKCTFAAGTRNPLIIRPLILRRRGVLARC